MRLKTFVNTFLGETWEDQGEGVDDLAIYDRREDYDEIPEDVVLLTAGVDVQDDRVEVEIIGWSKQEENWSIAYHAMKREAAGKPVKPIDIWTEGIAEVIVGEANPKATPSEALAE